jgi:hypothetical protein
MRFFDNWWEHLPTVIRLARLASLILAVLAMVNGTSAADLGRADDHYWE